MIQKFKSILTGFAVYISIAGLVTFSNFVLEESSQVIMFGTWPAQDAKNWELVLHGCDLMKASNRTLKTINYAVGWIQPIAFFAYRSYGIGTDFYIDALESKVFAHAPELFVGREVKFTFTPRQIENQADGTFTLINGSLHVRSKVLPIGGKPLVVQGRVQQQGSVLVIDTTG